MSLRMGTTGGMDMNALQDIGITASQQAAWYLVHCKPHQDERAEEHLARQGYACVRPRLQRERLF